MAVIPHKSIVLTEPGVARFLAWLEPDTNGGCHLCPGHVSRAKRYPIFVMDGITYTASRVAWVIANGEIPEGAQVLHKCDTPPCCNPAHLFLGSQKANIQDCIEKGRFRVAEGISHANAKLTEEAVREIRALKGLVSGVVLAKRFGVNGPTICNVQARRVWKHVS